VKLIEFDIEAKNSYSASTLSDRSVSSEIIKESMSLPIDPASSKWEILRNPDRLSRRFNFDDFRKMYDFISDILVHQEKMRHHALITIDHLSVIIESYTKDLNAITELDKNLADYADLVYEDVSYYYSADKVDNEKFQ
jgi:pterin-4a-carbinolamine dehydratase